MQFPQLVVFQDDLEGANTFMKENAALSPVVVSVSTLALPGKSGALQRVHEVTIMFYDEEAEPSPDPDPEKKGSEKENPEKKASSEKKATPVVQKNKEA